MPSLYQLLEMIAVLATAGIIGGIVLFAAVVAPATFAALDAQAAQRFLRSVFPRYYLHLIVVSAIAALCTIGLHPRLGTLLALIAVSSLIARQFLMPRINAARDAHLAGDAAAGARFSLLHRASVVLNGLQLLAACLVLVRLFS